MLEPATDKNLPTEPNSTPPLNNITLWIQITKFRNNGEIRSKIIYKYFSLVFSLKITQRARRGRNITLGGRGGPKSRRWRRR